MLKKIFSALGVAVLFTFGGCSNSTDGPGNNGSAFKVAPDYLVFGTEDHQSQEIIIETDGSGWMFNCKQNWVLITDTENSLIVSVERSDDRSPREGTITITSAGETITVPVHQKGLFTVKPSTVYIDNANPQWREVTVETAYEKWWHETDEDWIKFDDSKENLLISAETQSEGSERQGIVRIYVDENVFEEVTVIQTDAEETEILEIFLQDSMVPTAISENGRFVVGHNGDHVGFIWDTHLDGDQGVYYLADSRGWVEMYGVSNDGVAVGSYNYLPAKYDYQTAKWTYMDLTALGYNVSNIGTIPMGIEGAACSITPDGNKIVGYSRSEFQTLEFIPMVWEGNTGQILDMPATDHFGKPALGYMARAVSDDGTVYAGTQYDHRYKYVGAVWEPGARVYGQEIMDYRPGTVTEVHAYHNFTALSGNGEYIVGLQFKATSSAYVPRPYIYRRTADTTELLDLTDTNISSVSDSGIVLLCQPYVSYDRVAFIYEDGEIMSMVDWLEEYYGFKLPHMGGTPMAITSDSKYIVGFTFPSGPKLYVLKLGTRIK